MTEILEIKPSWSLIWTALYESVKKRDAITHVSGVLTGITHFLFKGSAAWRIMRHWNNRIGSKREKKKCCFFFSPLAADSDLIFCRCDLCPGPQSCPVFPHTDCFGSCLHQGHWEASRRKGTDSLSVEEVVNTGTQPPSWPWYETIHHVGLEGRRGWEVHPDGGHLTHVGITTSHNQCVAPVPTFSRRVL